MKKIIVICMVLGAAIVLTGCQSQKTTSGTTDNAESATLNESANASVEAPPMPPNPA